jgi:hypothetical protein
VANVTRSHNFNNHLDALEAAVFTALTQGGLILKQEEQKLSPEDTGRMLRSVEVSQPFRRDGDFVVGVGPTVDYAKYTELEPWIIGKRPGPRSQIKGATIPWIKPAVANVRHDVITQIDNGIRTFIRGLQASL